MKTASNKEVIIEYNKNHKSRGTQEKPDGLIGSLIFYGRNFIAMMQDKNYRFPKKLKFYFLLGIVYVLSPIDIIPEIIFGPFGLVDDLGLLLVLGNMLLDEVHKYATMLKR